MFFFAAAAVATAFASQSHVADHVANNRDTARQSMAAEQRASSFVGCCCQ